MQSLRFPERDLVAFRQRDSYYEGALVCRRAHVLTRFVKPNETVDENQKCTECGAKILIGCTACGLRIRGDYYVSGFIGTSPYDPPAFCDGCGAAHPWASREQRIYELENILDEEDIEEADRVFLHDRLRELREMDASDAKAEERVWRAIGQRSSAFLQNPAVGRIVETLVTGGVRAYLFRNGA